MSTLIRNSDLILKFVDPAVDNLLRKYDVYLEALYDDEYSFHREAVKSAVRFLLSKNYSNTAVLAEENWGRNPYIRERFPSKEDFITSIPLSKQKACSLDLATGTGKSFLMFGIAQLMLCEGAVDKILVLCPSLTIEEGLTEKFNELNTRPGLAEILREVNPAYVQPEIKNASETILANNICIENIHATYKRTGSSIYDSFKSEGSQVLVLNDEAHHIFTGEVDAPQKKWIEFLKDPEFNFNLIVNVTGTPYYGSDNNQYFSDVLYRFGLKSAVERGVVKKIDYKTFDEYKDDKGYQQSWAVHQSNIEKYGKIVKPISIVVCASIADAIIEWEKLTECVAEKEGLSFDEAAKKVIWVTSGLPAKGTRAAERIAPIIAKDVAKRSGETIRRDNLNLLRSVDQNVDNNPVEWIVSVAMLTEGWDVKNVFQVIPHEQRAFNSKLLISQVLGRGLRMPPAVKLAFGAGNVLLKVNNHEKWTPEIKTLYDDILEVENRLSWGYDSSRNQYGFTLHNLRYELVETTTEIKDKLAEFDGNFGFGPQRKSAEYKSEFLHGTVTYVFEEKETYSLDLASTNLYSYLKDKSPEAAKKYPKAKLKAAIQKELQEKGYEDDYLSKENYIKAQQSFGPLFRELGKEVPRVSLKPDTMYNIESSTFPTQHFSEETLKRNGLLVYTSESINFYTNDERTLFKSFISTEQQEKETIAALSAPGADTVALAKRLQDLGLQKRELEDHLQRVDKDVLKSTLNAIFVSYTPEIEFIRTLITNIELIESFLKSPDKSFYSFPYYYKPETVGKTHSRSDNFNPDFFLKLADSEDVLVVEMKKKGDDSKKNRAKFRQATEHFNEINERLANSNSSRRYFFKFLSDEGSDIADFFQSIRAGSYDKWKSSLMNQLAA